MSIKQHAKGQELDNTQRSENEFKDLVKEVYSFA